MNCKKTMVTSDVNNISNPYAQMDKNTVNSKGQLAETDHVKFDFPADDGIRVMFVGNSITLHGKNANIGWHNECGMAASSKEKDYVHLLEASIKKYDPKASFCICQVADWERGYKNGREVYAKYEAAREFSADLIILRFIENVPKADFDSDTFLREFDAFADYLNNTGKAKLVITTAFWNHPGNNDIRLYAEKKGIPCVELTDLGENDEMKAIGLFEHTGVANHPGDKGMKAIADRIMDRVIKEGYLAR